MANEKPDLFVIRVNARPVVSPSTQKIISGTLGFEVTRRSGSGKGVAETVDLQGLVVRPGDSIEFELGDVPFSAKSPQLSVTWKFPVGKHWEGAPSRPGQSAQIPGKAGFPGARFSFNAEIDLNEDVKLFSQAISDRGTTLIQLDPDIVVDEC